MKCYQTGSSKLAKVPLTPIPFSVEACRAAFAKAFKALLKLRVSKRTSRCLLEVGAQTTTDKTESRIHCG